MSLTFDPARLPPRDHDGFTMHPDLPQWGENESGEPILLALGFESAFVSLDDPKEDPEPPEGEGWLLGGIWDTEDGPIACFVRKNEILRGNLIRLIDAIEDDKTPLDSCYSQNVIDFLRRFV